jgi:hypothetical protein
MTADVLLSGAVGALIVFLLGGFREWWREEREREATVHATFPVAPAFRHAYPRNHCQNYCQSQPEGKAAHGVRDRRSGDRVAVSRTE